MALIHSITPSPLLPTLCRVEIFIRRRLTIFDPIPGVMNSSSIYQEIIFLCNIYIRDQNLITITRISLSRGILFQIDS